MEALKQSKVYNNKQTKIYYNKSKSVDNVNKNRQKTEIQPKPQLANNGQDIEPTTNTAADQQPSGATEQNIKTPSTSQIEKQRNDTPRKYNPRPNWKGRNAHGAEDNHQDGGHKVFVTGHPKYAQPADLVRAFSKFGEVTVEKLMDKFAVLSFSSAAGAEAAGQADGAVPLLGRLLHVRAQQHTDDKEEEPYPIPEAALSGTLSFAESAEAVLRAVMLTREEVASLHTLYADLQATLQPVWPGCVVMPFGSITMGLGTKNSDADCFVTMPPGVTPTPNFVYKARWALSRAPPLFSSLVPVARASTPLLKAAHCPSGRRLDVTFRAPLGVRNSLLVRALVRRDPRLQPAALLAKTWAARGRLSGAGRLSHYALVLLLVAYAQSMGLLPAVRQLQRSPPALVEHWDTAFEEDTAAWPPPAPCDLTLPDLLGGFFRYYATFDFDSLVVSPYLGRPIPRLVFAPPGLLPPELGRYADNVAAGLAEPFRADRPLAVQDPFELHRNLTSCVAPRLAADIRAHFRRAAVAFEASLAPEHAGFLSAALRRPPPPARRPRPATARFPLPPGASLRGLRAAVRMAWEDLLGAELTPVGRRGAKGGEAPAEGKGPEGCDRFSVTLRRAVWRRERFSRLPSRLGLLERERRVTAEVLLVEREELALELELRLGARGGGGRVGAVLRAGGGEGGEVFRAFARFHIGHMPALYAACAREVGGGGEGAAEEEGGEPGAETDGAVPPDNEDGPISDESDSD